MVVLPFLLAFGISLLSVPMVRKLSFRYGRVAQPRKDRWHSQPTPTLGGVAMFSAFALTVILSIIVSDNWMALQGGWSLLVGSALMFVLGLYDDFRRISPPVKLAGQMLAATIVIFFGNNTIDFFPWPIANILLTYFWLVGITNAINLLDNMDGLAGGVSLVAASTLCYFFWRGGNDILLILALSLAGGIFGFLVFNFPPAKIFMGDSGSLFLGFTLAALSIARRTQASNIFAVVGVPTLLFLLPILDTSLVTITRLLRGQSPAQGGTDHTSHRLIAFGLSERQAVLILYGIAFASGLAAAGLEALDYDLSLVLIPLLLIVLSLFAAYLARLKVITSSPDNPRTVTRFITDLTYKRRLFELLFDLMLIGTTYYLAFWTRYGLDMTAQSMDLFLRSWPIALITAYFSFWIFRVYKGVWKYVGVNDLIRYAEAVLLAILLCYGAVRLIYPTQAYTVDVFFLYGIFLYLGLAGSRSSFQILDRIYNRPRKAASQINVLFYGAGDAGEIALRWVMRNPQMGYIPSGFLDEDEYLWGQRIHDVEIFGGADKLIDLKQQKQIDGVIITTQLLLTTQAGSKLMQLCRENGIWVRQLRLEFEPIE
jgi:UDP-GlcNAc:undecaprenyl-phosphate GlcNAc-1-phosphate transferase